MSDKRNIYLLNPKELTPETIAVAFAKTSRSPKAFHEIAQELSDESSADFHEKWVLGYGHASVAEHAVLHIAIENISRLAIEILEANRLASYTEKSTRYQKWDPENYYLPVELENYPQLKEQYQKTCRLLFDTYQQSIPEVKRVVEIENPRLEGESDAAWDRRIRSDYVDVCRFLLPACSLANVGTTMNGRALEHAIQKMLSHPLEEVRSLGEEIKMVALKNVPTLVKYAQEVPYLKAVQEDITQYLSTLKGTREKTTSCRLIDYDQNAEARIFAAVLYRYGNHSYADSLKLVKEMSIDEQKHLASLFLAKRSHHDIPIRELEHTNFLFDLVLDQGAYFELKRHRIMSQTAQLLSIDLGYAIPKKIVLARFKEQYQKAMEQSKKCFYDLYQFQPALASYIVPNAFNRRVLLTMNLRSAFHLIQLRSASNAHFSIRRIALQILEQIQQVAPLLAAFIQTDSDESWEQIERHHFDLLY